MNIDFPTHLINTPCVVLDSYTLPTGLYDKDGNCVIKVPYLLTRPDGMVYGPAQKETK